MSQWLRIALWTVGLLVGFKILTTLLIKYSYEPTPNHISSSVFLEYVHEEKVRSVIIYEDAGVIELNVTMVDGASYETRKHHLIRHCSKTSRIIRSYTMCRNAKNRRSCSRFL